MGCNCKNTKKVSQPKQINKTTNRTTTPKTTQRGTVTKRIIRRRPI